jgi:predicted RNase H-like nuclease
MKYFRHDRHDTKLDAAVNKGLAAALLIDVPVGIKIMSEGGVPKEVITRVIFSPQQRRSTDWKH